MTEDPGLARVAATLNGADPDGARAAQVFRDTFDQLYDGQRTGRYAWEQLHKTEKTHFGTLIEINLRREFDDVIDDGNVLDFRIADEEVDCKYSFRMGGWMIPPECVGHLAIVCTANDRDAEWGLGLVRATPDHLRGSVNRDGKTTLNDLGKSSIRWLHWGAEMAPNVLLDIDPDLAERLTDAKAISSGQKRLNELFRHVRGRRITRTIIATVAQQHDYMKRARANGGSRTQLAPEGYLILGGDYESHRQVARDLGTAVPEHGEFVSVRVVPATTSDPFAADIDARLWRLDSGNEFAGIRAPALPETRIARRGPARDPGDDQGSRTSEGQESSTPRN